MRIIQTTLQNLANLWNLYECHLQYVPLCVLGRVRRNPALCTSSVQCRWPRKRGMTFPQGGVPIVEFPRYDRLHFCF